MTTRYLAVLLVLAGLMTGGNVAFGQGVLGPGATLGNSTIMAPPRIAPRVSAATPTFRPRPGLGVSPAPAPSGGPTFTVTTIERMLGDAVTTARRNSGYGRPRGSCLVSKEPASAASDQAPKNETAETRRKTSAPVRGPIVR